MIITISREYGAGGRTVARGLAQELGIEYYDIDFVRMTAKLSGYSEDDIRREGEDMSGGRKFINQFLSTNAYNSSYDAIFEAQREVILDLAKKPCIIVGRCSNMILREEGIDSFDIFLYADLEHRRKRALELNENGKMDIDKYIARRDRLRNTYYHAYTGHLMGDARDYNICLDTGKIGMDECVVILAQLLKDKVK
jgi:cytidylate kinase